MTASLRSAVIYLGRINRAVNQEHCKILHVKGDTFTLTNLIYRCNSPFHHHHQLQHYQKFQGFHWSRLGFLHQPTGTSLDFQELKYRRLAIIEFIIIAIFIPEAIFKISAEFRKFAIGNRTQRCC